MKSIMFSLTPRQVEAVIFACTNTLEEPTNFEHGSENESLYDPLTKARDKIWQAQKTTRQD